ncbi:MAG: hypothetical protein ACRYFX_09940 [Janthinobacterium lividum]
MAATTETVLFQVDIQANNARLAELAAQARLAKEEFAKLQAAVKAGTADAALLDTASVKLKATLAANTQETRVLTAANEAQNKAVQANEGSIEQLRAQLALGTAEYNKLSKAERDNTEVGQRLQANNKALSDNLKVLESAIGDTRRNVGNYGEALKGATVGGKELGAGLGTIKDTALKPFSSELDRGTGFLGRFKSGSDLLAKGLAGLKGAGETGAQGFKAVAAGILLTGLGVFLLLLQGVVTYFTSTNEGSKLLKQGLAGLGVVVNALTGAVFGLGKGLVEAAKNPKQAFEDLLGFLKNQVINRFTAFGVILEGIEKRDFKQVANGILQLNTGVENGIDKATAYAKGIGQAVGSAVDLTAQLQKLSKQRKELEVDEIKEKGRVDELLRLSKDRTLSAGERLAKLREAGKIENDLSEASLKITREELSLIQQRNALKGKLNTTSDEVQEERDKRKEYNATVAERNSTLASIKARQSRFVLEERAERAKAAEDAVKDRIAETEGKLLAVKAGSKEELALRQQLILQQAELERAAQNKTAADRRLSVVKSLVEISKVEDEFRKKQADEAEKERDRIDAQYSRALSAQQKREADAAKEKEDNFKVDEALVERTLSRQRTSIENSYAAGEIDKKEYDARVEAQEQASYGARIILGQHYGKDTSKLEEAQAKAHAAHNAQLTAEDRKLNEARIKNAETLGVEVGKLFVDTLNETGGSLQEFAAKVLILILDTLEKAALSSAAEATIKSIGSDPTPAGFIQAGITAGAITVAFESAKAVLSAGSAKPFGANSGAIVPGPAGSPNRDSTLMYLTPGEAVMTREAVVNFGPLLGHLNALAGGVNFAPGFNPSAPQQVDGGLTARSIGAYSGPTAAEIGEAVAARVPKEIGLRTIGEAVGAHNRAAARASSNQPKPSSLPFPYSDR